MGSDYTETVVGQGFFGHLAAFGIGVIEAALGADLDEVIGGNVVYFGNLREELALTGRR